MNFIEIFVSFIVGLVAGIMSTFWGTRLIDNAKKRDKQVELKKQFKASIKIMPKLLKEMSDDVKNDESGCMQFVVLKTANSFNSKRNLFRYVENDHPNIYSHLNILEKYGFIEDITFYDTPMYQFNTCFIEMLKKSLDLRNTPTPLNKGKDICAIRNRQG